MSAKSIGGLLAIMLWAFVGAAFIAAPSAVRAGDAPKDGSKDGVKEEPPEEPTEEEPQPTDYEAMLKDIDKVIGKVTIKAEDVKAFADNWAEMLGKLHPDEKFAATEDTDMKTAFEYALTTDVYKAWAKDKKIDDPDAFIRKSVRVFLIYLKTQCLPGMLDGKKKEVAQREKDLPANKTTMTAEEYKAEQKWIKDQKEYLVKVEKGWKQVKDPSAAEKKAVEDGKDSIQQAMTDAAKIEAGEEDK